MSGAAIPIMLCMEAHCLAGTITSTGQRVLEILNDPASEYLKMSDAALQPNAEGGSATRVGDVTVPKSRIAVCILTMEGHEAPERRRYGYVEKRKKRGLVLVQGYEVQGTLSFRGTAEGVAALGREFGDFFPVSEATVRYPASHRSIPAKVAIVNKSLVSVLHIG